MFAGLQGIDWVIRWGALLSLSTLILGVGWCMVAMSNNLVDIRPSPARLETLRIFSEDQVTMVALPLIAYIASIVTNVGTTLAMTSATEDERSLGGFILSAGGVVLVAISVVIVERRRRRHRQGPWALLNSWPDLHSEIGSRATGRGVHADADWLSDARSRSQNLAQSSSVERRLAVRARRLLPGDIAVWNTPPTWGVGPYKPDGAIYRVPLAAVLRWAARRFVLAYCFYGSCAAMAIWVILLAAGMARTSLGLSYFVFAAVAAVSAVIATRAELIFYRRLYVRNNWYVQESFAMLRAMSLASLSQRPRMPLRRHRRRRAGALSS
jgi:hypothetical protein